LKSKGNLVIFGGKIKDLAYYTIKNKYQNIEEVCYRSDFDLVSDINIDVLTSLISKYEYSVNNLGGFRLKLGRVWVDIWNVTSTWAFREGHITDVSLNNLIYTTFFRNDAILYHLNDNCIHALPSFWEEIEFGVLDINLIHNADPIKTCERIIKYLLKGFTISYELGNYLYWKISGIKPNRSSNSAFFDFIIRKEDINKIKLLLSEERKTYSLVNRQLSLF
jgi:hypothetical protein